MSSLLNRYWIKLTGDPASYSMENRAFNLVSVITLFVLTYLFVFDVLINQWQMCLALAGMFILQAFLYYNSLINKKYKKEIIIYAFTAYASLIANYHYNSGINGPTMFVFFLIFQLILTISPTRFSRLWVTLHIGLPLALYYIECYHPWFVIDDYPSRSYRFIDFASTYAICIAFIYFITSYLKRYYKIEKRIADERLVAISEQNAVMVRQNRDLERLNEEKNKMFSIVSHDLRAPIDSIRGYLEILSKSLVTTDEKIEIEKELLHQVRYTSELLQNVLYWSKAQMSGVQEKLVPVKLKDIIDETGSYRLSGAAAKNIKITYSIDKNIEVIADVDMLKIVFRNLLGNAVKFTPAGGDVYIKVTVTGTEAHIAIKDSGIGISEDKKKELFTLRSGSTFGTNDEKGVGLGLLLCKEFIERQHGSIWFESKLGEGSTFYLALPLSRF